MHIRSKAAAAVLAMAIVSFPNFARTSQQGPLPDQSQGPGGMGPRGPMGQMRPGEPRGQWGRRGMRGRGMGPREFGLGRLLNDPNVRQQLGVTADQAAKIRQQESDFRKTEIRNRADLQIKRMDLNDLLSADKPDRSAIDSKLQEIGAAQLALEKSAIDNRLTMRDALTPAQRQKLQQMMMQRRQPMPMTGGNAAPRGPRGGGGGGRSGAAPPPNARGQAPPNQ
jgi:Spy/CpxP family protein refolding chaperone